MSEREKKNLGRAIAEEVASEIASSLVKGLFRVLSDLLSGRDRKRELAFREALPVIPFEFALQEEDPPKGSSQT